MRDDRHRLEALVMDELSQVVNEIGFEIDAVRRPGAIAMAAQIGDDHMPVASQLTRDPVPAAGVIAGAMHQDQWRCAGVTPVHIVQAQALRNETMGYWTDFKLLHTRPCRRSLSTPPSSHQVRSVRYVTARSTGTDQPVRPPQWGDPGRD